jgi:hypothetical protein
MHHDVVTKSKMDDQHMAAKYLNAASSARICMQCAWEYPCTIHGFVALVYAISPGIFQQKISEQCC